MFARESERERERQEEWRHTTTGAQSSEDDFVESRVERASDAVTAAATAGSYVRLLQLRFLAYAC